jgi:hypothetical protein
MWRKVLAVLCVPVVLLLATSIPYALHSTGAQLRPEAGTGYMAAYLFGMTLGLAVTVLVVFFLSRWIMRTFWKLR